MLYALLTIFILYVTFGNGNICMFINQNRAPLLKFFLLLSKKIYIIYTEAYWRPLYIQ